MHTHILEQHTQALVRNIPTNRNTWGPLHFMHKKRAPPPKKQNDGETLLAQVHKLSEITISAPSVFEMRIVRSSTFLVAQNDDRIQHFCDIELHLLVKVPGPGAGPVQVWHHCRSRRRCRASRGQGALRGRSAGVHMPEDLWSSSGLHSGVEFSVPDAVQRYGLWKATRRESWFSPRSFHISHCSPTHMLTIQRVSKPSKTTTYDIVPLYNSYLAIDGFANIFLCIWWVCVISWRLYCKYMVFIPDAVSHIQ